MAVCGITNKHLAALIFTILAFIVDLIGFAAPYWYYEKVGTNSKAYSGIWRFCSETASTTVCFNYLDSSNLQGKLIPYKKILITESLEDAKRVLKSCQSN